MYNPYGNVADTYQQQHQRLAPKQPVSQQYLQHPQPHHPTQFNPQQQPMQAPQHEYSPMHQQQHPHPAQPMNQPHQQQSQQQPHQQQPTQSGFNFFNDPATALASQFARSGFEQSNQYLQENFGSFASFPAGVADMKYYFQVSNSYVFRKILLVLFPYRHKDWNRISTKETGQSQYLPPSHDINAPDLYIPLMSFVTYILLWAAFEGLKGDFHPQLFGYLSSQTLAFSILDVAIFKTGQYLLSCGGGKLYDIVCFAGYKYVSIIVLLCTKHLIGSWLGTVGYYAIVFFLIVNLAIFLMRSLRFLILPMVNNNPNGGGATAVSNSITSKQRKIRIQFLFIYSVIVQGLIILYLSK